MPKFRIVCTETVTYEVTVDAPSGEALARFYEKADADLFDRGCVCRWELESITRDNTPGAATLKISTTGAALEEEGADA